MTYQFNQMIFNGKSDYKDEVAGVAVDAKNYQTAVDQLQHLNKQFCEKRNGAQTLGREYNELNSSVFAQGGANFITELKNFSLDKFTQKDQKKPKPEKGRWAKYIEQEGKTARVNSKASTH